jgi:hypothetical protein
MDLESKGNGTDYVITLAAGATLKVGSSVDAVNLKSGGSFGRRTRVRVDSNVRTEQSCGLEAGIRRKAGGRGYQAITGSGAETAA